ncbi:hypothetical protein AR539_17410 [Arthrobacter sp. EPSL27]|nr:hypothetical protein AR539_17410 [Arthrobacter sp. EPSL27]
MNSEIPCRSGPPAAQRSWSADTGPAPHIRRSAPWGSRPPDGFNAGGPRRAIQADEQIADYIRKTHNTVYHPAGTVRMGSAEDRMSPLDPELRVKGVSGLRVADASVMPELTTVNPNITTMMIGERCAELVREARGA